MTDSTDLLFNQPVIVEACEEFVERDLLVVKGSFPGLLQDAPMSSTAVVNGLSQPLIYQVQLIVADACVSFDDLNVDLLDAAFPYIPTPAKQALQRALQDRGQTMQVNSAYGTIPQPTLLYNNRFNNSNPVAPPGASNHQTGLAINIEAPRGWEVDLMRYGWNPLPGDPPHFDYQGGGTIDLRSQSILAFQQLWNQNYPHDRISEDGGFGSQTEDALNRSPATGFSKAPWDDKPRTLRLAMPRMEGSDVLKFQEGLKKAAVVVGADGEFGPATDKAVKEFQQQKGLKPDGIVGLKTREQMA